jgi:hypothetical protein
VIRFGVVLTVVLTAMGLLAGGVLANSLLLVYLAIGAAALAAVMLTVGVVIWREEVFGASPAGQPGLAGQGGSQASGPSLALAAAGTSPAGRSAGGIADDLAAVGVAAAHGDLAMEPSPAALPPRPDRPARPEQQGHPDWPGRSDRPEPPERPEPRKAAEPAARLSSAPLGPSPLRPDARRGAAPDATAARERSAPAAEQDSPGRRDTAATSQSSSRPERALWSPSGAWPEPVADPVPGPRRGDEPESGEVAAGNDIWPRAGREPAVQSGSDAGAGSWSFFTKPGKPSVAEPGVTEAGGGGAGAARPVSAGAGGGRAGGDDVVPDEAGEPAVAREAAAGPAEREPAESDEPAGPPAGPDQASAKDAAAAGLEAEHEPSARSAEGTTTESTAGHGRAARDPGTEVTVVPGITRYHRSECILIRFLGPEDLETMTLRAAEAASYVACRACRPEQVLAGD